MPETLEEPLRYFESSSFGDYRVDIREEWGHPGPMSHWYRVSLFDKDGERLKSERMHTLGLAQWVRRIWVEQLP